MEKFFKNKFIKFIFFGGINTVFAYLILVIFLYLEFHYVIATFIAAIISIASGYFINMYLVFNSSKARNIFLYYGFWFILYSINILIQYLLIESISQNLYLNSFISTLITVIISFTINKYYFFTK